MASYRIIFISVLLMTSAHGLFAQSVFDFTPYVDTLSNSSGVNNGPTGYSGLDSPTSRAIDSLAAYATPVYIDTLLSHDAPAVRAAAVIVAQRKFPKRLWNSTEQLLADTSVVWNCVGCTCDERMLADLVWQQMLWGFGASDFQRSDPCKPWFQEEVQVEIDNYLLSGAPLAGYYSLQRLDCLNPTKYDHRNNFIQTGSVYALNAWLQADTTAIQSAKQFLIDHGNSARLPFLLHRLDEGWSPDLWGPLQKRIADAIADPANYENEQLLSAVVSLLSGQEPTPEARIFGRRLVEVLPAYMLRVVERKWGIKASDW